MSFATELSVALEAAARASELIRREYESFVAIPDAPVSISTHVDKASQDLILKFLHEKFPGCHLVFDAFSRLTADRIKAHPSLQKTGASVYWGIDDPHEIERWGQGIHLKEEWFFSQSPDLDRLGWFYRLKNDPGWTVERRTGNGNQNGDNDGVNRPGSDGGSGYWIPTPAGSGCWAA